MQIISTSPEVDRLLDQGAPLVICVSGGKDSRLAAETAVAYARDRAHSGPVTLCYSDLGQVVWSDAQRQCRQLADRLGVDLQIVRREAGGLMERWEKRWANNLARYVNLSCVKLILPWSTPSMRFCTSELKIDIIQAWIRKTFDQPVICVLGIRRDEGRSAKSGRGAAPVAKLIGKRARLPEGSLDWNCIVDVKTPDVFQIARSSAIPLPDAYEKYGASRYSCCFCILANGSDLRAAVKDPDNHEIYRRQCALEIESTFSFQSGKWLSDIAPELLTEDQRSRLAVAKLAATEREEIEKTIPHHLTYVKGWPTIMPTAGESELLAGVRREVARVMNIEVKYTLPSEVLQRYAELMAEKRAKCR